MQHQRKTLTARIVHDENRPDLGPGAPRIIGEAIARKTCIAATYNKTAVRLAPHIIYTKHDDMFIDAVVVEREGKPPKELKLGTFKLAGLSGIMLTGPSFVPQPVFDARNPKYVGSTLYVVKA